MTNVEYYRYRQRQYAQRIYYRGFQSRYYAYQLSLLAIYLRDVKCIKKTAIRTELLAFLQKNVEDCIIHKWFDALRKAMLCAGKKDKKLIQIDFVPMYKSEIEYIDSLDVDENIKRTVFTMMVQKKLDKFVYESGRKGEYSMLFYGNSDKRYKALPKVACLKRKRGFDFCIDVLSVMRDVGLIEATTMKNSPLVLKFVDKIAFDGEEVIQVTDYTQIGMYWDYLHDGKVGLCRICNAPFSTARGGQGKKASCCEEHRHTYIPSIFVECVCAGCGKIFEKNSQAVRTKLCNECKGGK